MKVRGTDNASTLQLAMSEIIRGDIEESSTIIRPSSLEQWLSLAQFIVLDNLSSALPLFASRYASLLIRYGFGGDSLALVSLFQIEFAPASLRLLSLGLTFNRPRGFLDFNGSLETVSVFGELSLSDSFTSSRRV